MSFIVVKNSNPIRRNCGHAHATKREAQQCLTREATIGHRQNNGRLVPVCNPKVLDEWSVWEIGVGVD